MSLPNPTHRECWKCGGPARPWPEPELCTDHLLEYLDDKAKDLAAATNFETED
jgi:hypothetical protein